MAVLIGLASTKIFTSKRTEFFRESGNGYDINAYFLAMSVVATIEHSTQALISACLAYWIRNPISYWYSYAVHFLLLAWLCVSWGLLIPMVVPVESVTIVTAFFFAFFGTLFGGAFPPVVYKCKFIFDLFSCRDCHLLICSRRR